MTTPLITRLEAAEGSRELDALVWLATNPTGEIDVKRTGRTLAPVWRCRSPGASRSNSWVSPEPVTTSLDAALALAERLELDPIDVLRVALYAAFRTGAIPTTPARLVRFVCIAILKATRTSHD